MTKEEHIERHRKLHNSLDELVADAINHIPQFFPSRVSLLKLMEWSALQIDATTITHGEEKLDEMST